MNESTSGLGPSLGTLRVRGGSDASARAVGAEFSSMAADSLQAIQSHGEPISLLKLEVTRGSDESAAQAVARAIRDHFGELRHGRQ